MLRVDCGWCTLGVAAGGGGGSGGCELGEATVEALRGRGGGSREGSSATCWSYSRMRVMSFALFPFLMRVVRMTWRTFGEGYTEKDRVFWPPA